jgi:hypothetical protein
MGRTALGIVVAALVAATPVARADPPPPSGSRARPHRAVVPDFVLAGAAHPELARVLSDAAARGATGAPELQIIAQSEIVALLGVEKTKLMLGCAEDACLVEVAGAADADRVVAGSLTLLERTALLTVRYVDTRKGRTLSRTTATLLEPTQPELVDAARRLAHEAVTGERLDTTGTVRIRVDRKGADVTLDGRSLGDSPLASPARVQEGPHTITVQKPGFVRWSTTIAVAAGREAAVDAELVPVQLLGETARSRLWTWGWVSAGVAAASTTSAIVFGTLAQKSHDRYVAATNRTEAVQYHDDTRFRATLSNVSWGVAGASVAAAATLFTVALVQDARATAEPSGGAPPAARPPAPAGPRGPSAAVVPTPGGLALAVGGTF